MTTHPAIHLTLTCAAGLALGFLASRPFSRGSAEPPPPPAVEQEQPPDRPWLSAWVAEQSSPLVSKAMPEVPTHLVPDTTESQIYRLAHGSIADAISAIHDITDDAKERRALTEKLVLDPLLRADPVKALEIARTWNSYEGTTARTPSYLFYDVPIALYPDLVSALLEEPPGAFRDNELPSLVELWARCEPTLANKWIDDNLPAGSADAPALNAIATAGLAKPGMYIPPGLADALSAAPAELRLRLYRNLYDAVLETPNPAESANDLVAITPAADLKPAAMSLALAWSHLDPEDASAWALSLPTTEARDAALGSIAKLWPPLDPTAAATWLGSPPPLQASIVSPIFARHLEPSDELPQ